MSFVDFKEVTSDNTGTDIRYGGNDLKEVMEILNGKVSADKRPRILNEWLWLDHFDMKPPGSAPGSPTETNSSRLYIDPSDFKLKIKKTAGTIIDVENLDIANSALQQITDKAKLHSSILYSDVDNNLGDHFLDFGDIAAPANPSAGIRRVFLDSATGEISVKTSAGTTLSLETGGVGGGGGGDVFLNQSNTFGDFDSTFRSSRLLVRNPANTFSYNIAGSAITNNRTVTLPLLVGNDFLVTAGIAQTLTNKILIQNNNTLQMFNTAGDRKYIFSVPEVASGADITISFPNTTVSDSLVSAAGSVTFTNKTMNVDGNTIKHSATNNAGDILKNNGTSYQRLARGTSLQVFRVNSGGTDTEWAALDSERIGKHQANGNGSTTVFNIAHGLGSNPTYAFADCSSQTIDFTYTTTSTNIVVTFASAPVSGTNNVVIYWRVVA